MMHYCCARMYRYRCYILDCRHNFGNQRSCYQIAYNSELSQTDRPVQMHHCHNRRSYKLDSYQRRYHCLKLYICFYYQQCKYRYHSRNLLLMFLDMYRKFHQQMYHKHNYSLPHTLRYYSHRTWMTFEHTHCE